MKENRRKISIIENHQTSKITLTLRQLIPLAKGGRKRDRESIRSEPIDKVTANILKTKLKQSYNEIVEYSRFTRKPFPFIARD